MKSMHIALVRLTEGDYGHVTRLDGEDVPRAGGVDGRWRGGMKERSSEGERQTGSPRVHMRTVTAWKLTEQQGIRAVSQTIMTRAVCMPRLKYQLLLPLVVLEAA